jgi:hypothetical protein
METLIHADVFFFVSTIALLVVVFFLAIVLAYVVTILKDVKHVTRKIREESDEVIEDLQLLRSHIKNEGFKIVTLGGFLTRFFNRKKRTKKSE